jgi:hypothetical protein
MPERTEQEEQTIAQSSITVRFDVAYIGELVCGRHAVTRDEERRKPSATLQVSDSKPSADIRRVRKIEQAVAEVIAHMKRVVEARRSFLGRPGDRSRHAEPCHRPADTEAAT